MLSFLLLEQRKDNFVKKVNIAVLKLELKWLLNHGLERCCRVACLRAHDDAFKEFLKLQVLVDYSHLAFRESSCLCSDLVNELI